MFSFVRRRMYTSALPLIIVLLGVFLLARLTGDPTNLYLPESATAEQHAEFAAKHGFDQPLLTQLGDYFKGVLHLDFGTSLRTGESASAMARVSSRVGGKKMLRTMTTKHPKSHDPTAMRRAKAMSAP